MFGLIQPKKYAVIIKVDTYKFIKYRGVQQNKFKSLYRYLDNNYKNWRWGNVYRFKKQIGSFTKNNRPDSF